MISRIGIFKPLPPDVHTEMLRNLRDRFMAALQQQEGYIGGYWLEGEDEQVWSVSFWESEEALREGGTRANATPLLPDKDPSKMPSADHSIVMTVFAHALGKARVPMNDDLRWFADQAGE